MDRGVRHVLFWAGLSVSVVVTHSGLLAVRLNRGWLSMGECTHCAKVVGGQMVSCDPS